MRVFNHSYPPTDGYKGLVTRHRVCHSLHPFYRASYRTYMVHASKVFPYDGCGRRHSSKNTPRFILLLVLLMTIACSLFVSPKGELTYGFIVVVFVDLSNRLFSIMAGIFFFLLRMPALIFRQYLRRMGDLSGPPWTVLLIFSSSFAGWYHFPLVSN